MSKTVIKFIFEIVASPEVGSFARKLNYPKSLYMKESSLM